MDPVTGQLVATGIQAGASVMRPTPSGASGWSDGWGMFDNSGWTVATGQGSADGAKIGDKGGGGAAAAGGLGELVPWLVVGVVALGIARAWRKS